MAKPKKLRNKLELERFIDQEISEDRYLEAHICKHDLWVEDCEFGCMDVVD